ncbi:hypothetical protein MJO28_009089 [Puccinia striiformis f. sp. tritici]|uniref:Uncharacterized protein n=2 Tax=Puccinia striiformis f. sp. tritici TaxID=168172 RepID=A0A0L0US31_9BASI|nr:hypothetical protein Pst134EA_017966 [Puccinia striiformis f. sp. tritici]KAI9616039.1 hypothetical protein H4Q26_011291 [Puccinia striiformis f. sp. tritici PST-130]KNE89790.1 hypothetical protein PSTG_16749 [Puccinia striiformis f. sp. tritici PST-78]KAH9451400.1 hypothetical protein Pst134EB_018870 [Puccinia striiformis f. sp. tritici]KAH9461677.1 hypothetical protein Pst134EA_017966 [Puccinia striiformis f. sp. tritici]KAI7947181.1 hypothetical protein MJO28_009089 [Puccinia striiformis
MNHQEPRNNNYNNKRSNSAEQQQQQQQPSSTSLSSRSISQTQQKRWYHRFRFSTVQYSLLALLALQSIAVISILSTTVAKIEKEIQFANPQLRTISTYLAIFIIANIFLILMTIDLLLNKNVVQLIALCFFNTSMAIYGAVLPLQIARALHNPGGAISWNGAREGTSCNMYLSCYGVQYLYGDIKAWIIAIPVIGGIVSILMGYLTWLIYKEFGWEIFKLIGADLGLKRILQKKYLFHMLQKFALFFFIGLSLQFLMLASSMSPSERILTICALPFSLGVVMLGGLAVSREIRWMMGVYYVCWTGATVYFIFKLIRLYDNESISAAVKSLTIFSVLTIALLFATGIVSILCYQNFGKGLLETPGVLHESLWSRFWSETILNNRGKSNGNGNRRTGGVGGKSNNKTKIDRQSRMTLGGRGGTVEELNPEDERINIADEFDHLHRHPKPEMIQLKDQHYRMSMD